MPRLTKKHITLLWLVGSVAVFFVGGLLLWAASLRLPDFDVFEERKIEQSTKIYDRTGEHLLYDLHENIQRTVVPFEDISRHAKNAAVAIEDADFYEHNGLKISSIIRAVLVNLTSIGYSQGGSTITQQVVKNALLTQEKTISRKIKEWVLSLKLEQVLSKEEILALYLNEAPYGGTMYGIEEASRTFFNKNAGELTLAESAYLAALPQSPTYYSPYGNHVDALSDRKNLVLAKMLEYGFINEEEHDVAVAEEVEFLARPDTRLQAPHFVFYIREYLERKYGQRVIEEQGLRVITTLDFELQTEAQKIFLEGALENEKNFNASNAGLVATDPKTGQILAMVGSRDYFDKTIDGNVNITLAHRQPGSSFKPFVYATAFKKGFTPDTILFDLPTQFSTACPVSDLTSDGECYSPGNYDSVYRGPMTIRNALAQSVNIPAVKALYLAGINESIKTARNMGITTLTDASRYGLTLVLGGGEVTLLEMTAAYGVFANDGVRFPITGILKVEDTTGAVLEEFKEVGATVLTPNIARTISDILSDNVARAPAFGGTSALNFPGYGVAVKTGTTNDYRDAWVIGYTKGVSVGAWAGNNDNTPMEKKVAGFIIAPMWHRVMELAIEKYPGGVFIPPEPSDASKLILQGIWQGGDTTRKNGKWYVEQDVHSILYWVDKDNPDGPVPSTPSSDPQFKYWEAPVRTWAISQGFGGDALIPIQTSNDSYDEEKNN
ncbi:MAG: PBP1A family penicillin-binding protein [Patescibacteria group bacterium]